MTCYGDKNAPDMVQDMIDVFEHNEIKVELLKSEKCCGMPKFELGDLSSVEALMERIYPRLLNLCTQRLEDHGTNSELRVDVQAGVAVTLP